MLPNIPGSPRTAEKSEVRLSGSRHWLGTLAKRRQRSDADVSLVGGTLVLTAFSMQHYRRKIDEILTRSDLKRSENQSSVIVSGHDLSTLVCRNVSHLRCSELRHSTIQLHQPHQLSSVGNTGLTVDNTSGNMMWNEHGDVIRAQTKITILRI